MIHSEAHKIALRVVEELRPYCDKIEIAGSIRRNKPEVKDIEIVVIPKLWETGLFINGIGEVISKWEKVKGDVENDNTVKYTQRILPEGIKLDLFFANELNWGAIFLIRTGDWEFSKKFMGTIMPKHGLQQKDGFVWANNKVIAIKDEETLFRLVGIPYIAPENRNINSITSL